MAALAQNAAIAARFDEAAGLLRLLGRDERGARRLDRLARLLETQPEPIPELLTDGRLARLPGVGPASLAEVREVVATGGLARADGLRRQVPPGLPPLLALPGLGVGRVRRLWFALGVTGVSDLEHACRTNRLRDLDGFGKALQDRLLSTLLRGSAWGRRRLADALRRAAGRTLDRLQRDPAALRLGVAGAVRRMEPVAEEVSLVATAHDPAALLDAFTTLPFVRPLGRNGRSARVEVEEGVPVTLEVANAEEAYVPLLVRRTGPPAHWEALVARAEERGLALDGDALRRRGRPLPLVAEEDLYAALDLPWIAPERRHVSDFDTAAVPDLVAMHDVLGCVHLHTVDGAGSFALADMARRAAQEGYAWAVIADRSRSAFPRGASEGAVARQVESVRAWNAAQAGTDGGGLVLFSGVEADVLPDGRLDAPDGLLEAVDVVLASLSDGHDPTGRPQDAAGLTARLCRAARHPRVHAIVHPTGRVLLGHPGWPVDVSTVLDACAEGGTAIGVSGLPHRLDLDAAWHGAAIARGLDVLPTADAHDLNGVDQALFAVGCVRRGGWPAGRVMTTQDAEGFRARLRAKGG